MSIILNKLLLNVGKEKKYVFFYNRTKKYKQVSLCKTFLISIYMLTLNKVHY